jgi:hypothetical protein
LQDKLCICKEVERLTKVFDRFIIHLNKDGRERMTHVLSVLIADANCHQAIDKVQQIA